MVGNLQGNFDLVWKTVAERFKNNRWVVGYDPYNEPFSTETQTASESTFTGQLECFYTGRAHTGYLANGTSPLLCPPGVPDNGVIPTIQAVDRHHLTFVEPDIYWVTGGNVPSQLGPMPFPRIVFNFHVYCGDRSPVTGNPTDLLRCLQSEETAASEQDVTRLSMSSAYQASGRPSSSASSVPRRVSRSPASTPSGPDLTSWGGSTGPGSTTTTPPARRRRVSSSPTAATRRS